MRGPEIGYSYLSIFYCTVFLFSQEIQFITNSRIQLLLPTGHPRVCQNETRFVTRPQTTAASVFDPICVCVATGDALLEAKMTSQAKYLSNMPSSYLVLSPSGLGADTYRLWEALAMG
jgi:hypothetical protein